MLIDYRSANEKGFVLVAVMLILLVLTVVGIAAMGTTGVEHMLSGNMRLREENSSRADGGMEIMSGLIEQVIRNGDTGNFAGIVTDANLITELRTTTFDADTVDVTIPDIGVEIDIDKMYTKWMGGSAMEFASGYEGAGKSGANGSYTYFRVNSRSAALAGSEAEVGSIYRYVNN